MGGAQVIMGKIRDYCVCLPNKQCLGNSGQNQRGEPDIGLNIGSTVGNSRQHPRSCSIHSSLDLYDGENNFTQVLLCDAYDKYPVCFIFSRKTIFMKSCKNIHFCRGGPPLCPKQIVNGSAFDG